MPSRSRKRAPKKKRGRGAVVTSRKVIVSRPTTPAEAAKAFGMTQKDIDRVRKMVDEITG